MCSLPPPCAQVLGNFASLEEEPKEGVDTVAIVLCTRGGIQIIHDVMKEFSMNSTILQAGLDALCNVCNDPEAALLLSETQEIVHTIISVVQSHDWDEQVCGCVCVWRGGYVRACFMCLLLCVCMLE